jgi:very-short-patch-repair endonuclease
MKGQTNPSIIDSKLPRKLRNTMTDAEIQLWQRLRGRQIAGCKFRRQHPFLDYVVDFACLEKHLVVEVDGGQHLDNPRDQGRDKRLQEAGFHVLRFWNNQVLEEIDSVVEVIWEALRRDVISGDTPSPPIPSPSRPPP